MRRKEGQQRKPKTRRASLETGVRVCRPSTSHVHCPLLWEGGLRRPSSAVGNKCRRTRHVALGAIRQGETDACERLRFLACWTLLLASPLLLFAHSGRHQVSLVWAPQRDRHNTYVQHHHSCRLPQNCSMQLSCRTSQFRQPGAGYVSFLAFCLSTFFFLFLLQFLHMQYDVINLAFFTSFPSL